MVEQEETGAQPAVLLIDDDEGVRAFLSLALATKGFAVEDAASGEQGLAALRGRRFAAILCDVNLPGRSGLELLPELRALSGGAPVIMLSGAAPFEDAARGVLAGAAAFVTKPVEPEDLYWVIGRAVGGSPERSPTEKRSIPPAKPERRP